MRSITNDEAMLLRCEGELAPLGYLNTETGKITNHKIENSIPLMGYVNCDEHPMTEPGYRPIKIISIEEGESSIYIKGINHHWAYCEFEDDYPFKGAFDVAVHGEKSPVCSALSEEDIVRIRKYREKKNLT